MMRPMPANRRPSRRAVCWSQSAPPRPPASRQPDRRPKTAAASQEGPNPAAAAGSATGRHPLTLGDDNRRLGDYERSVKQAFDSIEPALRDIAARQHDRDFETQAQRIAESALGFPLPAKILDHAWVEQLDMRTLYAWAVFETYRRFAEDFFRRDPLGGLDGQDFEAFIQSCGFHSFDVSPCADGRLAHVVRYALRLPMRHVRRKSYAGAMFDVEDSLNRWVETELGRFREGVPNTADESTRYLKVAMYHYSSSAPTAEGCAAHGSDVERAAAAALERLLDFQRAIQNSFCCGASIDLLLLGIDTDTDTLRAHVPDADGSLAVDRFVEAAMAYDKTRHLPPREAENAIIDMAAACGAAGGAAPAPDGMIRLIARLVANNISQIDYVSRNYGSSYPDIGHQERFIGAGRGFDEIQLRNLTYFAHLNTVEEAAADLDVGIRIFSHLNAERGLPIPVVVRFDYRGDVPGARERAVQRSVRVDAALRARYSELSDQGLLHTMLAVRDCRDTAAIEIVGSSLDARMAPLEGAH